MTTRYYSHVPPGLGLHGGEIGTTGEVYAEVKSLTSVGPHSSSIDEVGGIAKHEPVRVTMIGREASDSDGLTVHPYLDLMRLNYRGSSRFAKLATSLPHGYFSGVDVEVDRDVSGWTVPGFIHIGQEAIYITGTDGDGSSGDPWRFTGCDRASAYTQTQAHPVNAAKGEVEYVTQEPTEWQGRRARVYVAPMFPDGTVGTWVEYWRGFVDSLPTMAGDIISIDIAPMTIALTWQIGLGATATTTRTVPNWHYMTAGIGSKLRARLWWPQGTFFSGRVTAADVGAMTVDVFSGADALDGCDFTLTPSDPHRGILMLREPTTDTYPVVSVTPGAGTSATIEFASAAIPTAVSGINCILQSAAAEEFYEVSLLDEDDGDSALIRWPVALTDAIRRHDAWRVTRGGGAGIGIAAWSQPDEDSGALRWAQLGLDRIGNDWFVTGRRLYDSPGDPWVAMMFGEWDTCAVGSLLTYDPGQLEQARAARHNLPHRDSGGLRAFDISAGPGDDPTRHPVLGPPVWYYQPRELYVGPFEDNIYTGSGGRQVLRISGWGGSVDIGVVGAVEVFDEDAVSVGWVYEVANPDAHSLQCVIQMEGDAPLTATLIAQAEDVPIEKFILRLIMSGSGAGQNGVNDVMPLGLNYPEVEVDQASFAVDSAGVLARQTWECNPGKAVAEQIRPLLLAMGGQIVQVYDGQNWVIRLVMLTPPMDTDSVATLTDADCTGRIENAPAGRVIRSYLIRVNFPQAGETGEPVEVPYVDTAARNAAGGNMGETLTVDLRGVRIEGGAGDRVAQLLDVIASLRARIGFVRAQWRAKLTADVSSVLEVGVGDTVALTSAWAIDTDPSRTVSGRPCRVMGVKRDLLKGTLALELAPHHGKGAGYVPALRVATTPTADTVTVSATEFAGHGLFAVGDAVLCVPIGDWANKRFKVITGISGVTYTIVGHGLVAGDTIRFANYSFAVAARDAVGGYAFIADADEAMSDGSAAKVIG